jgi:hypothetical protein
VGFSCLILFVGAALTTARVVASGKGVVPRKMAVRVKEEVIEEPMGEAPMSDVIDGAD